MKSACRRVVLIVMALLPVFTLCGQTVTELVIPKYFGSKTAPTANSGRTAFAVCFRIDGLAANTTYDLRPGIGLVTEAGTTYGAGNYWNGTTFSGTTSILNCFTTDAAGSSGAVWIFIQPTGNSSRFDAGQVHNLRLGWVTSGGSLPSSPLFVGTKTLTALDIATTPRTPATTDDGCFVKGSSLPPSNGKYMLMYDNDAGTGDPLFAYQILPATPTQTSNTELPAVINDVYMQTGTSAAGDYPAVIPIGANNPSGVRRVESRNADNTVYAFNTSTGGIWPSGANTTTALRRDVVILTSNDTPLASSGPGLPTVATTTPVTNISFNSATGGGNVTNDGGSAITARGLCWGTAPNPTLANSYTTEPGTTGSFISNMTGLQPSTNYHVRAYATNATGTSYGAGTTFSTLCGIMAPEPHFYASKVNLTVGESIDFFDSTLYCPASWQWSFIGGDPAASTLQNPVGITYNYAGDFTVCLTATNEWGQQTECRTAYIHVVGPTNAPLVITEINYRSPLGGTDSLEFIEIYNNGASPVDLLGFAFTRGVEYTFPAATLGPWSYALVAKSPAWIQSMYNVPSYQWNTGSALSNSGEAIVLKDLYGYVVDSVYYLPVSPWDTMANGHGPTLQLCDPSASGLIPENWRHAVEYQGKTPSGDSLFASPLEGCSYLPVANFLTSDSTIVIGQTVTFSDASTGDVTSWYWEFERGNPETFNGQNPPPVQYNVMGAYDVTLTVQNATGQSKKYKPAFIQVGPAGLNPAEYPRSLVSPTVVTDGRFDVFPTGTSPHRITVFSLTGETMLTLDTQKQRQTVRCQDWPSSLYIIRITNLKSGKSDHSRIIIH